MHLEFLVEEPSAEAALLALVPRIVGPKVTFGIHVHQGKSDLLGKLPFRLRGYQHWLPEDWRIVVLLDEDRQDCTALKSRMELAAQQARFNTRSVPGPDGRFQVLNRLAIEELEAWLLGDPLAVSQAYPGVPPHFGTSSKYRDPDSIVGGTWEQLQYLLQKAGYYRAGMPAIETARSIANEMDPERNCSRSFCLFRDSLRQIVAQA